MSTGNPYAPPRSNVEDMGDMVEPADRITRLAAAILDGLIAGAMIYGPMVIVLLVGGAMARPSGEQPSDALFALAGLLALAGLVTWIWLTVLYVARNGQTIAKKILSIKVVRPDGSPASLGRIFWLRNFVNGLLGVIPLYGLIDVLFIFGDRRQCLHDMIADTVVVRA